MNLSTISCIGAGGLLAMAAVSMFIGKKATYVEAKEAATKAKNEATEARWMRIAGACAFLSAATALFSFLSMSGCRNPLNMRDVQPLSTDVRSAVANAALRQFA